MANFNLKASVLEATERNERSFRTEGFRYDPHSSKSLKALGSYHEHLKGDLIPQMGHPKLREAQGVVYQAALFNNHHMLPLFDFLLEQHKNNPHFLGHVFIGDRGNEGFEILKKGDSLTYESGYWDERSLSIHGPAGAIVGHNAFAAVSSCPNAACPPPGMKAPSTERYGTVVFNERFYERICSPEFSDRDLDDLSRNVGILVKRLDTFRIPYSCRFRNLEKFFEDNSSNIDQVNSMIPFLYGEKTADIISREPSKINEILLRRLEEIIDARKGFPRDRFFSNDTGYRAHALDPKEGLMALSITQEDIKYW
jgi:hypothetical protein